ncbi:DGF-1-like protein [Gracilaria domingensis]|nr:DGF-1-like protein [Gracilaria domingensis]
MVHAPLSRRSVLRVAAFSVVGVAAAAIADGIDTKQLKEELKEDVKELNYEEEVTDVGPDAAEKNVTRIRKKEDEPAYKVEERELVKEEKEEYAAMLEREAEEDAKIKAKFSKSN